MQDNGKPLFLESILVMIGNTRIIQNRLVYHSYALKYN